MGRGKQLVRSEYNEFISINLVLLLETCGYLKLPFRNFSNNLIKF